MKGKVVAIFLCFSVVFCVGISVAYYNTKTFGFDEGAYLMSKDDEKITIMDFNIYYDDIDEIFEKAGKIVPQKHYTVVSNPLCCGRYIM